jgi:DNA-binding transcriptional regulator YiaG
MAASDSVKRLRLALCLEQAEFGALLNVTKGTVSNWEHGLRVPRLPKIRRLVEIAKQNKVKFSIEDFLSEV